MAGDASEATPSIVTDTVLAQIVGSNNIGQGLDGNETQDLSGLVLVLLVVGVDEVHAFTGSEGRGKEKGKERKEKIVEE